MRTHCLPADKTLDELFARIYSSYWNVLKSWQHRTWEMSYSKVDCRPEGYLSFPHPVCRESPALAREKVPWGR